MEKVYSAGIRPSVGGTGSKLCKVAREEPESVTSKNRDAAKNRARFGTRCYQRL